MIDPRTTELQANLDEVKVHEKEARNLLAKLGAKAGKA